MLTKKYLNELAARLKALRPNDPTPLNSPAEELMAQASMNQWRLMVQGMADFCQAHNPRFDRVKFLKAAGMVLEKTPAK